MVDYYGRFSSMTAAAKAASLAALAKCRSDFYAELNNSAAADQYRNSWIGFTAPESVEIKPSTADPANPGLWKVITPYAPS